MQLISHLPWQGPNPVDCSELHKKVISQDPMPPRTIFLFGVSPMWARVRPYNSTQDFIEIGAPGWAETIHEGIDLTLSQLSNRTKVVFIQPHRQFNPDVFNAYEARNDLANCNFPPDEDQAYHSWRKILLEASQRHQVPLISFDKFICPNNTCRAMDGETRLFLDAYHIMPHYGAALLNEFLELVEPYF